MKVSITYNGVDYEFDGETLDVGPNTTDGRVKEKVAATLGEGVDLSSFSVNTINEDKVIYPSPIFG